MTDRRQREPKSVADETLDRVRRIETRFTAFLVAQGFTTEAQKPQFDPLDIGAPNGMVTLPSPHTSIAEIISAIPVEFPRPVEIFLGDQHLATIRRT